MASQNKTVEQVLQATDIVDLITEVTPLEKKGKNYFGLCPFHHEKTPSFSVNEEKQLYHCFSCKAGGNALTFVKDTKHVSSADAIKYLADRANITIDTKQFDKPNQKYFDINKDAETFYHIQLTHTVQGETALNYLNDRGITQSLIETFNIGVADDKFDSLYNALSKRDTLKSDMLDLGLIAENESVYDVFRNRIIFPIHNEDGDTVGFSGRVYESNNKQAKYINSPQTILFEKSQVLYNLHRAKPAIKEHQRVVLFEGFMDVIAAHKAGINEGVAVMGTALTNFHLETLKKLTQTVVLCFDQDQAGKDATRKFINDLIKAKFTVLVVTLEDGLDPDDYLKKHGKTAFNKQINNALTSYDYLYDYFKASSDFSKITEVERFKKRVFDLIEPLSNVEKSHYIERLSKDANVSKEVLEQDFNAMKRKHLPTYRKVSVVDVTSKFIRIERGFIHYFLKDEFFVRKFRKEFKHAMFTDKHARDIKLEILEYYDRNKHSCLVPNLFYEQLSSPLKAYYDKYINLEHYPLNEAEFNDFLVVMREYNKRELINRLKADKNDAKTTEEKIELQEKIDQLNKEAKHGKRKNNTRTY